MMLSRRNPSDATSSSKWPSSSGPRCRNEMVIAASSALSGGPQKPAIPHMSRVLWRHIVMIHDPRNGTTHAALAAVLQRLLEVHVVVVHAAAAAVGVTATRGCLVRLRSIGDQCVGAEHDRGNRHRMGQR